MRSLSITQQNTLGLRALHRIQTIEVEEVVPVERVLMELVNGHQMLSIYVLPQGLLAATPTLVCNQGLQHGSHHIQLVKKNDRSLDLHIVTNFFYTDLPLSDQWKHMRFIPRRFTLSLNTERISHSHLNNTTSSPRYCLLKSFDLKKLWI